MLFLYSNNGNSNNNSLGTWGLIRCEAVKPMIGTSCSRGFFTGIDKDDMEVKRLTVAT